MVQERFLFLEEIDLKYFLIFLSLPSMHISSNEVLDAFNSLIQKDLSFYQEIIISRNDKTSSEGFIIRKDKIIEIVIEEPFQEKYIINSDEVVVYDFEFNQSHTVPISENEAPLLNLLRVGAELNQLKYLTNNSFKVNYKEKYLYVELLSDNSFLVDYKDNMNYKNIVTFTSTNL
jgi:outer membrane lipoprotein-sorting protein